MTNRQRIVNVLHFRPVDRLPHMEWATWWDQTLARWHSEGMPKDAYPFTYFGLDVHRQFWLTAIQRDKCPPERSQGGWISSAQDYENLRPFLYNPRIIQDISAHLKEIKPMHDRGDFPVWITLEGFFWFPRVLFGIEEHLYSFYDEPDLYHQICHDLVQWQLAVIEEFCEIIPPDFMTFAEDMSYNYGSMISKATFDEFILPYYHMVVPVLKKHGIKVLVDSDGNVEEMIPWFMEGGIEGILPLERQAGTDIAEISRKYPEFLMVGGFDKMTMKHGEAAMRAEFERILPVMRAGGYIPSVDHQTPPEVSIENYKLYVRLLKEYCGKI
ncbi:MAG TPA: hypothetical protein GX701_01385 [Clostridiales bacterium]|nr:hypothetical protein [Clostridiales bacterium]